MSERRLIVPSRRGREVRDVIGTGEMLPTGGRVIDLSDPAVRDWWHDRESIGWVNILPDPADEARRKREADEAERRKGEAIRAAEEAARKPPAPVASATPHAPPALVAEVPEPKPKPAAEPVNPRRKYARRKA